MNPLLLWLTTFLSGLAMAAGTMWFGFIVLGVIPTLDLIATSAHKRIGLSGLLLGFGGLYLALSMWISLSGSVILAGLALAGSALLDEVAHDRSDGCRR